MKCSTERRHWVEDHQIPFYDAGALERASIPADDVQEVLMGNVVSAGVGQVTNSLLWIACCQHILKTLVMFYGRK